MYLLHCISLQKHSWHPPFKCKHCNYSRQMYHLNMCLPSGETLLTAAALEGLADTVELLLTHGAAPNIPSVCGEAPLAVAVRSHSSRAVQLLLEAGANPDVIDKRYNMSPLQTACYYQQLGTVKLLLDHGVRIQPPDGMTPHPLRLTIGLDDSCTERQLDMTRLLLDHGAGVNDADVYGNSPFLTACNTGNQHIVKLFLQHGADLRRCNKQGCSPLELAVAHHRCDLAQYLVAEHRARDIPVNRGSLLAAIFDNCMACFELCMEQAVDISAPFTNRHNVRPVLFAIQNSPRYMDGAAQWQIAEPKVTFKRLPIVRYLIEAGAELGHWWQEDIFENLCHQRPSEELFLLLVRAYGFQLDDPSMASEAYITLVFDGLIHSSRLLCQAGYTPTEDQIRVTGNLWRRIESEEKRVIFQEIKDLVKHRQTHPLSLQECCVISVRGLLNDNVIYKSNLLSLPTKLKDMITLNYGS